MWHVTMSQLTFKTDHDTPELQTDPNGFLFDPRIREVLKRQGRKVEPGTEALAAVRILGKKLHLTMERWAERFGLSEGRFQILVRLKHQPTGRFTMGELAEMLCGNTPNSFRMSKFQRTLPLLASRHTASQRLVTRFSAAPYKANTKVFDRAVGLR